MDGVVNRTEWWTQKKQNEQECDGMSRKVWEWCQRAGMDLVKFYMTQQLKLNIFQQHMLPIKFYGTACYFKKLKLTCCPTLTVFLDNQAAIVITHCPKFHVCTKHINISYHFLRDLVKSGTLNLVYVNLHTKQVYCLTKGEC